jgi:tRNA pseudouridine55 synthase
VARARKGQPIHGWLNIDKPHGMSSAKVVAEVKRLTNAAKAGHGGTLDPLATGVLPVALGEATKTTSWAMTGRKTYRFVVRWGEARNTDDAEGEVSETSDIRPDPAAIEAVLAEFTGEITQTPPAFSAIKIDGKRAYKMARDGEDVEMPSRLVQIECLELLDCPDIDHAAFEVTCGKGTYIRALGRDIARRLGTVGFISDLSRTAVGEFRISDAISLDSLNDFSHSAPLNSCLLPVEAALDDIPAFSLTGPQAQRLQNGQMIRVLDAPDGLCRASRDGKLIALVDVTSGEVRAVRVFNL